MPSDTATTERVTPMDVRERELAGVIERYLVLLPDEALREIKDLNDRGELMPLVREACDLELAERYVAQAASRAVRSEVLPELRGVIHTVRDGIAGRPGATSREVRYPAP